MSDGGDSIDYRPPSDNLVDLHISIVPMEHWVERLNYASHKVISDTFSVGFVRVLPDMPLAKLRLELQVQLGENFFPKSYVFLKHVGRCLALVRQNQERQLKVKTFLPPHSVMPEIFVLPGQPTMYTYTVLPPIKPRMQDLHKSFSETESVSPEPVSESSFKHAKSKHRPPKFAESLQTQHSESLKSSQLESSKHKLIAEHLRKSLEGELHHSSSSLNQEIQSTQKDTNRQKRHISGKSSLNDAQNVTAFPRGQRGRTTPGQASDTTPPYQRKLSVDAPVQLPLNRNQPSQAKSVLHEGPQKRKVHYNMPTHSSTNSSQAFSDLDPFNIGNHHTLTNPALRSFDSTVNQSHSPAYRNHNVTATSNKRRQFISTSPLPPIDINTAHQKHALYLSTHNPNHSRHNSVEYSLHDRPISGSSSGSSYHANPVLKSRPYNQDLPSLPVDPQTLTVGAESRGISQPSTVMDDKPPTNSTNNDSGYMEQDHSDSDDSVRFQTENLPSSGNGTKAAKQLTDVNLESSRTVHGEVTRQASPSPIRIPKFHKPAVERQEVVTSPASSTRPSESKSPSVKQPIPSKASAVVQDQETERRLSSSDRAKLWAELQNARSNRRLAEKERQDLVKQAKVTTSKLNQKRTSVRDIWKKKFFEEKKRTMPLEEICRRLQSELDSSHRKLVSALEGEKVTEKRRYPTFLPVVASRPSVKSNSKILVTRLQHDMDGLRRKIEDAKIKLTGEIKLRHQAEEDVKVVRRELLSKKIRAHVAYREAVRGQAYPSRA